MNKFLISVLLCAFCVVLCVHAQNEAHPYRYGSNNLDASYVIRGLSFNFPYRIAWGLREAPSTYDEYNLADISSYKLLEVIGERNADIKGADAIIRFPDIHAGAYIIFMNYYPTSSGASYNAGRGRVQEFTNESKFINLNTSTNE